MTDMNNITTDKGEFPDGKIILLDGRVVDCYPRAVDEQDRTFDGKAVPDEEPQSPARKPQSTDKEKEADKERFIKNAFFFFAHKERILTDSRMFLCPVPIQSGMSISGTSGFENPTLGVYLQWWERCEGAMCIDKKGRHYLVFKLAGSSLSGHNVCDEVCEDGKTKCSHLYDFKVLRDGFIRINNIYKNVKQKYQAYSLQQVLDILDHEEEGDRDYANVINEQLQSHEINVLNERVHHLNAINETLERRCRELERTLYDERILHYYDGFLALQQRVTTEIEGLKQQKRDLKAALHRGDYDNHSYERRVNAISQRIKETEQELTEYKNSETLKTSQGEALPFWYIEDQAKKLREK